MRNPRVRGQDGFVREVLWIALTVAVIAIVFLDGLALFNANRSASDDAQTAANEARNEYAETMSVAQARKAAEAYLTTSEEKMTAFKVGKQDGMTEFTVGVKGHADTYGFVYLKYVPGLDDWVQRVSNPSSTQTSEQ